MRRKYLKRKKAKTPKELEEDDKMRQKISRYGDGAYLEDEEKSNR
jgi:hypothetical protein